MSDELSIEEVESKLSLEVRKPQQGKTSICINSIISDKSQNIHLVLTMNTLASGMQFYERMVELVGPKRLIVFNSKKETAGDCHHAKSVTDVMKIITSPDTDIKAIVCCAHEKRIRKALPELFERALDSKKITDSNRKFIIHIDEAHKYIPENERYIKDFNLSPVVAEIIGYSATPNGIWNSKDSNSLFYRIPIRDVEKELLDIRSENYFGVKNCGLQYFEELDHAELANEYSSTEISSHILSLAYKGKKFTLKSPNWYIDKFPFNLGNEALMMGFLNNILPKLNIVPDQFSYHFAPAYPRVLTHYQCAQIILTRIQNANVIVLNGDGYKLLRNRDDKMAEIISCGLIRQQAKNLPNEERKQEEGLLREPAYMIQQLIKETPNCPTFITGFECVSMSVTLINPQLGNFDNVIISHQHFTSDKLYQLCRFLFNYARWTEENKKYIKTTKIYSLTKEVVELCLEYEAEIDHIITDCAGKSCTLRDITGLEPEEPSEREIKKEAFDEIELINKKLCMKFKVYEGNDEDLWKKAHKHYESILGKRIIGKSMPKKNEDGFYLSSDSKGLGVQVASTFKVLETEKWSNRFQLKKDCLSYAHVFVGYENLEDPSEYSIFIKCAQLKDTSATREYLAKYYDNTKNNDEK